MTNTFDKLCENILKGTQQTQPNNQQTPNSPAVTPATPQPTPPAAPPQQQTNINDDDLFKVLQQKLNDQKFKDALLKMLNPQQQNAVNKPV